MSLSHHWNEVQPVDVYRVKVNGILTEYDQKVITYLYQPLIGPICLSLYTTLWSDVQVHTMWGREWTHYHLMNMMNVSLKEIYEARLKLEGIGLLKTFVKETEEQRFFIYELQPPLDPERFFSDGMLNVYLYQKIGRNHFMKVKSLFLAEDLPQREYADITRSFQDVYTSEKMSKVDEEALTSSQAEQGTIFFERKKGTSPALDDRHFDFDLLLAGLTEAMVPRRSITSRVKEAIIKLSYLYQINAIDMKNIVLSSVNVDQTIDIEALRKAARDWYQLHHENQLPELVDRIQPVEHRTEATPNTEEEQLISYLETTSPRQLLIDISGGATPAKSELKIIEDVMFQQKLLPGVVNVLIHYVMLKTDMKLTKGYVEKIASHWARKNIRTVREAMELAKKEHRQYLDWAEGKKNHSTKRKPVRTEKLPDWFVEEKNRNTQTSSEPELDDFDYEAEKRKLEEELRRPKN
ncbi:replication initiation and membrane attachment family protein [Aeribacillus pallidus]|uniref:replication initiation and membrane attachment family protein n=1 Tax=Aeribacillus pallidus TaxID=33936 RepID=UPI003D212581